MVTRTYARIRRPTAPIQRTSFWTHTFPLLSPSSSLPLSPPRLLSFSRTTAQAFCVKDFYVNDHACKACALGEYRNNHATEPTLRCQTADPTANILAKQVAFEGAAADPNAACWKTTAATSPSGAVCDADGVTACNTEVLCLGARSTTTGINRGFVWKARTVAEKRAIEFAAYTKQRDQCDNTAAADTVCARRDCGANKFMKYTRRPTVDDATTNLGRTRHEAATLRKALQKSRGEKEQLQRQLAKMDREMTALKQPKPAAAPKSDAAPAASLSAAVRSGDLDQVELQLSIGANPNEQDTKGLSPLMVATVAGATELMSLLLATKADVQAADPQYGMTALHVAANAGRNHAVRLLLEHAADVSALTKSEETALHRAARRGHLACVQALLRAGCDPLGKTRHGTSALSLADEHHANAVGYRERKHAAAVVGLLLSPEGVEVTAARRKLRVPEVAPLSATARPQPPVGVRPRRPTSANDATKSSPRSGKQLQPSDDSAGLEVRRAKLENTRLLRKLQQSQAA